MTINLETEIRSLRAIGPRGRVGRVFHGKRVAKQRVKIKRRLRATGFSPAWDVSVKEMGRLLMGGKA